MQISKDIQIIDLALWLKKEQILVINDLHLGYEEALQQKGLLVPKFQIQEIVKKLEKILQTVQPKTIVINGDLKHEFGRVSSQEWRDILALFDFLLKHCPEVLIIKGNHDVIIGPVAEKKGIRVVKEFQIGKTIILHGDRLVKTDAERLIIGHEHPAITIHESSKWEKYKCFLQGKWRGKELMVMPSFNPLLEGTDVLKEQLLSPFLDNLQNFIVFIVSKGEVFKFGKVKDFLP